MNRSSRRPPHRLVVLVVLLSVVAAACGGDDDDAGNDTAGEAAGTDSAQTGTAQTDTAEASGDPQAVDAGDGEGEPVAGGTLIVGLESEVDGLNPANNAFDASGVQMGISVFDTLAVHTEDGETVPFLAESFSPDADFTEWTITLREGVTFHDGTPFNADAVEAAINATLASPLVSLALLTWLDPADAVEVVDESTVVITTKVPTAHFPSALTAQLGMMPSPTWLEAIDGNQDLAQEPVGTGPFRFESRVQDQKTVFVRNDDWWGNEVFGTETYLERLEFHPVPNVDTRTTSLLTGAFNGSHTTNPDTVQKLREEEESGAITNLIDDTGEEAFVMINADPSATDAAEQAPNPFQFLEARRALTLATPKERYLQVIGLGELESASHMFHPSQPFYVEGVVQEADDPDQARAIAEEFCADPAKAEFCDDGKINMQFKYVGGSQIQDDIADVLTAAWGDAGFNVDITNTKQDSYITEVALNQYQVVIWRQFGAVDPDSDVVVLQCESIGVIALNFPRFCDQDRDALILAQRAEVDEAERTSTWAEIVDAVNQAYSYVFLTHTRWVNSYDDTVKGLCSAPVTADGQLQRCTINGRTLYQTVWIDPS